MAEKDKISLHKVMESGGEWHWESLPEGLSYFGLESLTPQQQEEYLRKYGALIIDKNGWPVSIIKPPAFRPDTPYLIDTKSVLENGFKPEYARHHQPIKDVSTMTTGSEVEVTLHGVRVSQEMLGRIKNRSNTGGYATLEVRDDMVEMNRPVVNATFNDVFKAAKTQNHEVQEIVSKMGGAISFDSSASLLDPTTKPPQDDYVNAMAGLLADGYITKDPEMLRWIGEVSYRMLGRDKPMTESEVRSALNDHNFARRVVNEFCSKAHHIHLRTEGNPNPNFYGFALNHIMGGIGLIRSAASFSGPFKNGMYLGLQEVKQIQRLIFETAGFQPAYNEMGTKAANDEIAQNLRLGSPSLTRAYVTDNKGHGNSRIRTEKTLLTAELLFPSTHPIAQVEAAQVMAYAYDMVILSHYYKSGMPAYARKFYANPDPKVYNHNRRQIAQNGPYAIVVDGFGNNVSYSQYMKDYTDFLQREMGRLGIKTPPGEIVEVSRWLNKSAQTPREGWNIDNYLNEMHPDFGVGSLSTHLIGELSAALNGDNVRAMSWNELKTTVPEGIYDEQIGEVIDKFIAASNRLYQPNLRRGKPQ